MKTETFKYSVVPLKGLLTNHARKFLSEEEEVEDVIQETFLKLWEMRSKLENHPNLTGLSVEITKNLCRNRLKVKKKMDSIEDISLTMSSKDLHAELESRDELNEIMRIIEILPPLQRQIFKMKHIEEYEVEEIADIMGSSREAVRMHLSRARRRVSEIFRNLRNEK